jgi:hypothetical protein
MRTLIATPDCARRQLDELEHDRDSDTDDDHRRKPSADSLSRRSSTAQNVRSALERSLVKFPPACADGACRRGCAFAVTLAAVARTNAQ